MAETNLTIVKDVDYPKSNVLIGAKFSASLMENKLMALALSDPARLVTSDGGETIRVTIPASEIKLAMGGNAGSFYRDLKRTAQAMNNRQIGIVSDDSKTFAFYQIIQTAIYDNSELKITFNSDLSKYIKDLTESFTMLNLPVMMSFKSGSSFRLYELLRARTFNRDRKNSNNHWTLEYNLYELYLQLGIVNSDDEKVKRVLGGNKNPDYEKAVEIAEKKKTSLLDWNTFKKSVLNKSIAEINEKSDLNVEYTPIRGGIGGKVKGVIFSVTKGDIPTSHDETPQKKKISEDELMDFLFDLRDLFGDFPSKDLRTIAEASNYDMERCKKAFEVYRKTDRSSVDNPVGFIVKAIKEGWETSGSSQKKKNSFNSFEQNTYNYEELEKVLLAN